MMIAWKCFWLTNLKDEITGSENINWKTEDTLCLNPSYDCPETMAGIQTQVQMPVCKIARLLPMWVHCVGSPNVCPQDVKGAVSVPVLQSMQGKQTHFSKHQANLALFSTDTHHLNCCAWKNWKSKSSELEWSELWWKKQCVLEALHCLWKFI